MFALLLNTFNSHAQKQKLSCDEKFWALLHPFAAIKVKHLSKKILPLYKEAKNLLGTPEFINGGRIDAFRHAFYMAAFAQKVKVKKLRTLGVAHEKGNYRSFKHNQTEDGELPDSLGTVMDLFNNEFGFKTGIQFKNYTLPELQQVLIKMVLNGEAMIMKRKKDGTYLTCEDKTIELKDYAAKWSIPKCLVPSNFSYSD